MTKLILAVDSPHRVRVVEVLNRTRGLVDYYKFGSIPFAAIGPELIQLGHDAGAGVFLDLKFHDIPNTVAGAAEACVRLGVEMFNVHCSGGREMMLRTMERVRKTAAESGGKAPLVFGVTVLTSHTQQTWAATLGIAERPIADQVRHFALLARECGLDGVVASPWEIEIVKQACGAGFRVLTPGIRLADSAVSGDDQARTLTPAEAVRRGADFIVVGRPIIEADDPAAVCARIRREMAAGQENNEQR